MNQITSRFISPFTSSGALDPAKAFDGAQVYNSVCPEGIWLLDPNANPTSINYNVRLYFDDGGGGNPFAGLLDNQFAPLKRPTGSTLAFDWTALSGTSLPAAGTPGRTVASGFAARNGWTTFSEFAIGRTNSPLPVELVMFGADCNDQGHVLVKWSTASETNNSHFVIERSYDAVNFTRVASVQGAGNSNQKIDYIYVDSEINANSRIYYRITQYDFDGASETSNVIAIQCESSPNNTFIVIPNPVAEGASVQIIGQYKSLQITDLIGQVVDLTVVGDRIYNLSSGVYILTFDEVYKVKLIVH